MKSSWHFLSPWNLGTQLKILLSPKSKSHCHWRLVSKSWCRAPSGAHNQIFITVWQLRSFLWSALSVERAGLFFVYAAGPCQRSLSRVRVPWYSRPYFTVSDLRLPFSSPPTTRRFTVEVFDPASTRVNNNNNNNNNNNKICTYSYLILTM
jgi:hypothetical protein